jgi:hypothetical protein
MSQFDFPSLDKTGEVYEPPKVKASSKLTKKQKKEHDKWKKQQFYLDNPDELKKLKKKQRAKEQAAENAKKDKDALNVGFNPGQKGKGKKSGRNFGSVEVQKKAFANMKQMLFQRMLQRKQ